MLMNRKCKPLKLVRFGELMFDQQKRTIIFCSSCDRHYLTLESFQKHSKKCIAVKHIYSSIEKLQYDEKQKKLKLVNGNQELHIYEPYAVRTESSKYHFDWEADLKNSSWCMEDSKIIPIEPKQPYNVRTLNPTIADDKPIIEQSSNSAVNGTLHVDIQTTLINNRDKLHEKRNVLAVPDKLKSMRYVMESLAEEFWRLDAVNPSNSTAASNPTTDGEAVTSIPSTDESENASDSTSASNPTTDDEALTSIPPTDKLKTNTDEIIKRLIAGGMNIKRRNTLGPLDGPE